MISNEEIRKLDDTLGGGGVFGMLAGLFDQMEWAEDEISKARRRHPRAADTLYHSFCLLTPTHDLMKTEVVYRAHCRELLERAAAGQDTRPGTAAEVCLACSESSHVAPLTDTAAGLYGRMWAAAGLPGDHFSDRQVHHEALDAPHIDDAEREMRRRLTVADRTLAVETCPGMHHGEAVRCAYAKAAEPEQLTLDAA